MSDKIKEILVEIGYDLLDRGNNYRAKPLYRDSDSQNVLSIDKDSGLWYDFKEKRGGKFEELIRLSLRHDDITETKDWIKTRTNGSGLSAKKEKPKLKMPKKYPKDILHKLRKDHSFWEQKGIRSEVAEIFEGGVANAGQMANRYVFPIFNSTNDIVGFTGRYLREASGDFKVPKWKHIGATSSWCFPLKQNKKYIFEKKEVVLVESVGDMLALWNADVYNVVVTFGLTISKSVTLVLLRMDVKSILISFNNDFENNHAGNRAAENSKKQLSKHFDLNQIKITLPPKNDFGDMTVEEIKRWRSVIN
jgi:DNA primase